MLGSSSTRSSRISAEKAAPIDAGASFIEEKTSATAKKT
jgi:hypothetical protein